MSCIVVVMVKKQKSKTVSRKFLYTIVGIQMVIFTITATALFMFTSSISMRTQGYTNTVNLMAMAIYGLTQEASPTPDNSYQYIPEAKLRFKKINNQKIFYTYNQEDSDNKLKSSVTITSDTIKRQSMAELYQYEDGSITQEGELFDELPAVQNCNKIFVLSYDDKISNYHGRKYALRKTLNTGNENIYLWKNTGTLCDASLNVEDIDEFEQMLQSVESY